MIRIDEIYNNTFWPWIKQNVAGTRMFFCDPPGDTSPNALFNFGHDDIEEEDYIFFHDQEPVHLDAHGELFDEVLDRMSDVVYRLNDPDGKHVNMAGFLIANYTEESLPAIIKNKQIKTSQGHVIVSEHGEHVEQLCDIYGWKSHYYFYHGWACQDWFRGYDKSFLIPRARDRAPTKTFMSPNRIVAGKRDHRVLFLYHVFKQQLEHNHISAPRVCVYENVDIVDIAKKYNNIYPDIEQVFRTAELPRLFAGEETQQMASCWLTNFTEAQDSLVYVPTETVYFGRRLHITEKTFKAIALEMPFVLMAPAGSLEYMRSYGFKTFDSVFDESYDQETDDQLRVEKVVKLLKDLDSLSVKEREQIHRACVPLVEHNFHHFYQGGLTSILWPELQNMLYELQT
jgi:hypothetical protein